MTFKPRKLKQRAKGMRRRHKLVVTVETFEDITTEELVPYLDAFRYFHREFDGPTGKRILVSGRGVRAMRKKILPGAAHNSKNMA